MWKGSENMELVKTKNTSEDAVAVFFVVGILFILILSLGITWYCLYKGYSNVEWGSVYNSYAVVKCVK